MGLFLSSLGSCTLTEVSSTLEVARFLVLALTSLPGSTMYEPSNPPRNTPKVMFGSSLQFPVISSMLVALFLNSGSYASATSAVVMTEAGPLLWCLLSSLGHFSVGHSPGTFAYSHVPRTLGHTLRAYRPLLRHVPPRPPFWKSSLLLLSTILHDGPKPASVNRQKARSY